MKKFLKIMLVIGVIFSIYSIAFNTEAKDTWIQGENFLDIGSQGPLNGINTTTINSGFMEILDFLWGIGLLIIFISTFVLGMKYMLASPNDKARIKQATTPYIIGVVIIFGAVTIWKFIIDVLEGSMLGR